MRFKKPRGVLLGIGFGAFVIAAVLFFVVPIICGEGFQYNGANALLEGLKGLINFNFSNVLYTALIVLFVIALSAIIVFAVVIIDKKYKKHLFTWFFTLVAIFGSYVIISTYFLGKDIEFNGAKIVSGSLLDAMMKTDGQILGKILSSVALAFVILSNVMLIVHLFVAMVAMMVTDQIKDFEKKLEAEKEEEVKAQVAEIAASAPAVQVSPVVEKAPEVAVIKTSADFIEQMSDEERKERELKLFKECVDSGYFSEYEELEFPEPIEGLTEEPVCEASVVEEKSSVIRHTSVHVGYTHE